MEIRSFTFWEYMLLGAEMHTGLSDHFMYAVNRGASTSISIRENGQVVSYAIISQEVDSIRLQCIYTHPQMRRKGYATKLITHLLEQSNYRICTTINMSIEFSDALIDCLNKLGFKRTNSGSIYTANIDDTMWEKMDRLKIVKMKELLLRGNAECIPFREMDESVRDQLLNSVHSEFGNKLDPAPFLVDNTSGTDTDFSTIMLKDGTLCSYIVITRPSEDAVCFDQISEAHNRIGAGSILAPLCCALEVIHERPEIKKFTLHILDNNQSSADFFLSMFSKDELRISREVSYTSY